MSFAIYGGQVVQSSTELTSDLPAMSEPKPPGGGAGRGGNVDEDMQLGNGGERILLLGWLPEQPSWEDPEMSGEDFLKENIAVLKGNEMNCWILGLFCTKHGWLIGPVVMPYEDIDLGQHWLR